MMKLTPLDIRKKEFDRSLRGFDPEAVNTYLETLAEHWEEAAETRRNLEARVQDLQGEVKHYRRVEETLQEALHTTRQSAEQQIENAKREARTIVQEAEAEAREVLQKAQSRRERVERDTEKIEDRRGEILARLRAFLASEMELLGRYEGQEGGMSYTTGSFRAPDTGALRMERAYGTGSFTPSPSAQEADRSASSRRPAPPPHDAPDAETPDAETPDAETPEAAADASPQPSVAAPSTAPSRSAEADAPSRAPDQASHAQQDDDELSDFLKGFSQLRDSLFGFVDDEPSDDAQAAPRPSPEPEESSTRPSGGRSIFASSSPPPTHPRPSPEEQAAPAEQTLDAQAPAERAPAEQTPDERMSSAGDLPDSDLSASPSEAAAPDEGRRSASTGRTRTPTSARTTPGTEIFAERARAAARAAKRDSGAIQKAEASEASAEEQAPPPPSTGDAAAPEAPASEAPASSPVLFPKLSVAETRAAEQPAAEQPAAEQPAAEQPATPTPAPAPVLFPKLSVAEQPAAEQPAAEQPAASDAQREAEAAAASEDFASFDEADAFGEGLPGALPDEGLGEAGGDAAASASEEADEIEEMLSFEGEFSFVDEDVPPLDTDEPISLPGAPAPPTPEQAVPEATTPEATASEAVQAGEMPGFADDFSYLDEAPPPKTPAPGSASPDEETSASEPDAATPASPPTTGATRPSTLSRSSTSTSFNFDEIFASIGGQPKRAAETRAAEASGPATGAPSETPASTKAPASEAPASEAPASEAPADAADDLDDLDRLFASSEPTAPSPSAADTASAAEAPASASAQEGGDREDDLERAMRTLFPALPIEEDEDDEDDFDLDLPQELPPPTQETSAADTAQFDIIKRDLERQEAEQRRRLSQEDEGSPDTDEIEKIWSILEDMD